MNFAFATICVIILGITGGLSADQGCEGQIEELRREMAKQKTTMESVLKIQANEIVELKRELKKKASTDSVNIKLENIVNELKERIDTCQAKPEKSNKEPKQEANGAYNAHGCPSNDIPLSCPGDRTIFVTHAEYGQYGPDYSQPTCAPHPFDCVETMSSVDEDQWVYLKLLCDNRTNCTYPFDGFAFREVCEPGTDVDYVSIYYDCLPDLTDEAVGFTAYFTSIWEYYNIDDIVVFDLVESNMGGYFHTSSSQFICPIDGLYAFNICIKTYESFSGHLMMESALLVGVSGYYEEGGYNVACNFVMTVCYKGERIWLRSQIDGNGLYGDGDRESTFSGFLLNRL